MERGCRWERAACCHQWMAIYCQHKRWIGCCCCWCWRTLSHVRPCHTCMCVCVSTRLSLEHIAADALPLQTFKNSHSKASGSTSTSTINPKNNDSNRVCSTNGYRQPSSEPLRPFVAAICRIQHLLNAIWVLKRVRHHVTGGRRVVYTCSEGNRQWRVANAADMLLLPLFVVVTVSMCWRCCLGNSTIRASICCTCGHLWQALTYYTSILECLPAYHNIACAHTNIWVCWHNKATKVQLLPVLYFFNLNSSRKTLVKSRQKSTSGQQQSRWTSDNKSNCSENSKKTQIVHLCFDMAFKVGLLHLNIYMYSVAEKCSVEMKIS